VIQIVLVRLDGLVPRDNGRAQENWAHHDVAARDSEADVNSVRGVQAVPQALPGGDVDNDVGSRRSRLRVRIVGAAWIRPNDLFEDVGQHVELRDRILQIVAFLKAGEAGHWTLGIDLRGGELAKIGGGERVRGWTDVSAQSKTVPEQRVHC